MIHPRSLLMDIDYADLAWAGDGSRKQLRNLWDHLAECGFAGAIQDCFFNGQALYQSPRFAWFSNPQRGPYQRLVERLREFDPLAESFRLAGQRGLECHPYVRLVDEAFSPGHADELFLRNPHLWYQTRCGGYGLTGLPCFAYSEVRELFLRRCHDLVERGAKGFFFGASRSHAGLFTPYFGTEGYDIWGFNPPVVEEYRQRFGVDIGRVESVSVRTSDEPRLRGYRILEYNGVEAVDEARFRAILGQGVERFLRSVRARFPDVKILIELSDSAALPGSRFPHNLFLLDMQSLMRDGVVNEWIIARDWRKAEPRFEHLPEQFPFVQNHGGKIGAWINDLFTPDGGSFERAPLDAVAPYLTRLSQSQLDRLLIHEAEFLLNHPQSADIWREFQRLFST